MQEALGLLREDDLVGRTRVLVHMGFAMRSSDELHGIEEVCAEGIDFAGRTADPSVLAHAYRMSIMALRGYKVS